MQSKDERIVVIQRLAWVTVSVFLFVYLVEKGEEVPQGLELAVLASIGVLLVWVDVTIDLITNLFRGKKW